VLRAVDSLPVIHSGDGVRAHEDFLKATEGSKDPVLVVGLGKSGLDAISYLSKSGRKPVLCFRKPHLFLGFKKDKPPPLKIAQSRAATYLWPARVLSTKLQRFLHNARFGVWLVQKFFVLLANASLKIQKLDKGHVLRAEPKDLFWNLEFGGAVTALDGNFYDLVQEGKVDLVGPTQISSLDGNTVHFENGQSLQVSGIICATGWSNSFVSLFDKEEAFALGLTNRPPSEDIPLLEDLYLQQAPAPRNNFPAPLICRYFEASRLMSF
jgi:dimethylaniline monooxygenase (N-oxide forming)